MKAIMVMFDSLNQHLLPPYGCEWVHAPNFERLSKHTVTFDNCYAGSLPCMPARREIHTGRYNFLHRSWGPLEPFDDSMPNILKKKGVYTHLVSDHCHYWEEGGATYHTQYNSWEISRGQEGDPWKGQVKDPEIPECISNVKLGDCWRQDWVNRQFMDTEEKQPQAVTFKNGIDFIEKNHKDNNWFLQIETFDPHEPFFTQNKYKELYPHEYNGKHFDWTDNYKVTEENDEIQHARYEYAALVSMCDNYLGKVLDMMDQYDMWEDTMLIVNTDHGYLLGEHEWWGKNVQPFYNEIVNIPFFVWDPRSKKSNERRKALVQTIDIAPTLLDFFSMDIPKDMQGKPLKETIESDEEIRDAALFGMHGGHVSCTDGRYVYMRAPVYRENQPINEYTLMPAHINTLFDVRELSDIQLEEPFDFTKGCRVMKINSKSFINPFVYGSLLFDLQNDPHQNSTIDDLEVERKMIKYMSELMVANEAPKEQFERLGIPKEGEITVEELKEQRLLRERQNEVDLGIEVEWRGKAKDAYFSMMDLFPMSSRPLMSGGFKKFLQQSNMSVITEDTVIGFAKSVLPSVLPKDMAGFFLKYIKLATL